VVITTTETKTGRGMNDVEPPVSRMLLDEKICGIMLGEIDVDERKEEENARAVTSQPDYRGGSSKGLA
jgi:hypothetical protein